MSLFERIQKRILIEKKSDSDYFAKDDLGRVYKTQKDYDNRPFTNYEKEQAKKANISPQELRKKFKGAKYDGPPFARDTRKFDTRYTKPDGTKRVSPSFFDKRSEFGIKDDGKVDVQGVKNRMGSRFFSAREKQYKAALKLPDSDPNKKRLVSKYGKFLKKAERGSEGSKFLNKLTDRVTTDSIPGGGRRISKGKFERTSKVIDTTGKSLARTLKSYSDYTSPTVPSKAKAATGKKFKTFDGSPPKGLRKGTRLKLPMQGGPNEVDFDVEKLPKGKFDSRKNVRGIDKAGYARVTDSKGKFIKMKDFAKNTKRQAEISADLAKGVSRADKGGYLTAKVYSGTPKQQAAFKKAFEKGKEDFYKTTHSKKVLGVSNKTGDFNLQFKADKARLDLGGKISQGDGLTKNQRKKIIADIGSRSKRKAPKIGKGKRFVDFAKKTASKGFKGFRKLPLKGKAAVIAGAGLAAYGIYRGVKGALTPGQLDRKKDFTPTSAITDTKGKKIRFKYDTYNPATKTTTSAKNLAGPTITKDQLGKFTRGEYNIKDQSGKKIDLEKNIQQSAFTKQLRDANKGTGFLGRQTKKDKKFLQKYKKAAEYRGIKLRGIK